jgi:hypothetical protein
MENYSNNKKVENLVDVISKAKSLLISITDKAK